MDLSGVHFFFWRHTTPKFRAGGGMQGAGAIDGGPYRGLLMAVQGPLNSAPKARRWACWEAAPFTVQVGWVPSRGLALLLYGPRAGECCSPSFKGGRLGILTWAAFRCGHCLLGGLQPSPRRGLPPPPRDPFLGQVITAAVVDYLVGSGGGPAALQASGRGGGHPAHGRPGGLGFYWSR